VISGIAIDAGWLRLLEEEPDFGRLMARLQFLQELNERRIPLLLDFGGHIIREYQRNLSPRTLGQLFFTLRMKLGPVYYFDGCPTKGCREALRSESFDTDDVPYVAVAQHANGGAYLTHETKHCEAERQDTLRVHCGVHIGDYDQLSGLLR
jgi:hypothetical protein